LLPLPVLNDHISCFLFQFFWMTTYLAARLSNLKTSSTCYSNFSLYPLLSVIHNPRNKWHNLKTFLYSIKAERRQHCPQKRRCEPTKPHCIKIRRLKSTRSRVESFSDSHSEHPFRILAFAYACLLVERILSWKKIWSLSETSPSLHSHQDLDHFTQTSPVRPPSQTSRDYKLQAELAAALNTNSNHRFLNLNSIEKPMTAAPLFQC
jgi:hypothetical protein